jgi:hypothetical protein
MFLRILKSNPLIALVFPPLVAVLIWGAMFITHQAVISRSGMPMFDVLCGWLVKTPLLALLVGIAMLLLQAFVWNAFINKESLLKQSSYFPVLFYILLFSCRPLQIGFYPALVSSMFLILSLKRLSESYKKEKALSEAFDAGIFIGIASLIYLPVSVFLLFLWIALLTIRSIVWREFVVSFIGFILPFGFALAYYSIFLSPEDFWYDKLLAVASGYKNSFVLPWPEIFLWCVLGVISLISLFVFLGRVADNVVKNQKIWALMVWFLGFAIITVVISPQKDGRALSLLGVPLSFIFSNYFLRARSKWIPEFLFLLILAAIAINIFY